LWGGIEDKEERTLDAKVSTEGGQTSGLQPDPGEKESGRLQLAKTRGETHAENRA